MSVYLLITLTVRTLVNNQTVAIDQSRNILLLGHSMGECAVDPSVATSIANYCQSSEHAMQSYLKLKYILRDNPQIDTVMFTFCPSTFGSGADSNIFENGAVATIKMKLFHPLMGVDELLLFWDNQILYENLSPISYFKSVISGDKYINELGGFINLERYKLQKDIELRKSAPAPTVPSAQNDDYQKLYLSKMISLCKDANIEFIFIQLPIYQADVYFDLVYSDSVRRALFPDIKLIDFKDVQLPDSAYADITHLNYRGAKIFSKVLMEKLGAKEVMDNN